MESTTKIHAWVRGSGQRQTAGSAVTVQRDSVQNLRWLYKQFRKDGLAAADARMNLVFAFAAGQRDMRARVYKAVR